jgi:uncharacterized oligopeptide transporter (OPT) family protein
MKSAINADNQQLATSLKVVDALSTQIDNNAPVQTQASTSSGGSMGIFFVLLIGLFATLRTHTPRS